MQRIKWFFLFVLIIGGGIVGCSGAESEDPDKSRVYFIEPSDGETVSSPIAVKMGADNFTVEPAGESHDNAGHLHIMINEACVTAGELIANDETHLHFGDGSIETELVLEPGEYQLCLQAADGAHVAFDDENMQDVITIIVE